MTTFPRERLSAQATTQIIRWVSKTAFVIDGLDERKRTAVTQEQKDALRNGSIPKDVMLWILPLPPMSTTVHFEARRCVFLHGATIWSPSGSHLWTFAR